MKLAALAVALFGAAVSGCTSVRTDTIETGLFENDADKFHTAWKDLRKRKQEGEVFTAKDLKRIGFNFEAPNVTVLSGVLALKRVFGEMAFQDQNGVEGPVNDLEEFDKYVGYSIPYRRIETTVDRIYISELELTQKGSQSQVFLLLRDGKLCYVERYSQTLDTYYSHYSVLEGVLDAIKAPGKAALKLLIKIENYQHPGLQYWVPIPID